MTEKLHGGPSESANRKWWLKNIVLPIIGTLLGVWGIAALVGEFRPSPTPTPAPGAGSNLQVDVPPPIAPQSFSRELVLHPGDSKIVQGASIEAESIGEQEDGRVYVVLVVSDGGEKVRSGEFYAGRSFNVRNRGDESLDVTIRSVEQRPKDPTKTWADLKKLGLLANELIERKAVVLVSGSTRSLDPLPASDPIVDDDYWIVNVPFLGPTDARKIAKNQLKGHFDVAVGDGDLHAVEVYLKLGVDVNALFGKFPPLMLALLKNDLKMFKFLLAHNADPDTPNGDGHTTTEYAAKPQGAEFAKALEEWKKAKKQ